MRLHALPHRSLVLLAVLLACTVQARALSRGMWAEFNVVYRMSLRATPECSRYAERSVALLEDRALPEAALDARMRELWREARASCFQVPGAAAASSPGSAAARSAGGDAMGEGMRGLAAPSIRSAEPSPAIAEIAQPILETPQFEVPAVEVPAIQAPEPAVVVPQPAVFVAEPPPEVLRRFSALLSGKGRHAQEGDGNGAPGKSQAGWNPLAKAVAKPRVLDEPAPRLNCSSRGVLSFDIDCGATPAAPEAAAPETEAPETAAPTRQGASIGLWLGTVVLAGFGAGGAWLRKRRLARHNAGAVSA